MNESPGVFSPPALLDCAPDLDISYCFWPERPAGTKLNPRPGPRCHYHFETTFRHPELPDYRCADMASETWWPPTPDEVLNAVGKAVASLRKIRACYLHSLGKLPESGWERDLADELKLDEPAP